MRKALGEADPSGEPGSPATVSALLRKLNMTDKSANAQRFALRGWLTEHPPGDELKLSLRSNGFGILLAEIGVKKHRIPPISATHKLGA